MADKYRIRVHREGAGYQEIHLDSIEEKWALSTCLSGISNHDEVSILDDKVLIVVEKLKSTDTHEEEQ